MTNESAFNIRPCLHDEPKCSKRESRAFTTTFCESYLSQSKITKNKRWLYGFCSLLVPFSFQWTQAAPIVGRSQFSISQSWLINILMMFIEDGNPKVIKKSAFLSHGLRITQKVHEKWNRLTPYWSFLQLRWWKSWSFPHLIEASK